MDRIIGDIWFSDSVGIIGTPVDVVVQVKEQDFARFSDELVVGTITLRNPEITKGGQDVIEFTLDSRREEFDFVVPQVETVPAVLTYDVLLYVENPGDANEYFEASLVYQFLVNQGTPAT
ncbi:MAG: hypothetical protein M5R36_03515 [Deltaproteobacteria bacterium]|nr:hypothetical protein [Deltaproteobacteria bacterium]